MAHSNLTLVTLARDNVSELARTVRSVVAQNERPGEHIVVDSSESSQAREIRSICKEFNLTYHWSEPAGIFPAMRKSVEFVQDDHYVWWLNSTDRLIGRHSVSIVHSELLAEGDGNEPHWILGQLVRQHNQRVGLHRVGFKSDQFARLFSSGLSGFPHPSAIFRVALLKELDPYAGGLTVAEDYRLGMQVFTAVGAPRVSNSPLAVFTSRGGNSSQDLLTGVRDRTQTRFELLAGWSPWKEALSLSVTLPREVFDRIFQRQGWRVPLSRWVEEDPAQVHLCSRADLYEWPECCERFLQEDF